MYEYKIKEIVSIYDGDTIVAIVDLGFGITIKEKFRLSYINAPELKGSERESGLTSRDWLREKLNTSSDVFIKTQKDSKEKFGRYLAEIFIDNVSINYQMISEGIATEYK